VARQRIVLGEQATGKKSSLPEKCDHRAGFLQIDPTRRGAILSFPGSSGREAMRPTKRDQGGQQDLLRSRLDQIVDLAHPLAKLARNIDWSFLEQRLGAAYTDRPGRPPLPTRLMTGLAILKHMHDLSDEMLCERWLENPYSPVALRRGILLP
jgi:hypothetical protein